MAESLQPNPDITIEEAHGNPLHPIKMAINKRGRNLYAANEPTRLGHEQRLDKAAERSNSKKALDELSAQVAAGDISTVQGVLRTLLEQSRQSAYDEARGMVRRLDKPSEDSPEAKVNAQFAHWIDRVNQGDLSLLQDPNCGDGWAEAVVSRAVYELSMKYQ